MHAPEMARADTVRVGQTIRRSSRRLDRGLYRHSFDSQKAHKVIRSHLSEWFQLPGPS